MPETDDDRRDGRSRWHGARGGVAPGSLPSRPVLLRQVRERGGLAFDAGPLAVARMYSVLVHDVHDAMRATPDEIAKLGPVEHLGDIRRIREALAARCILASETEIRDALDVWRVLPPAPIVPALDVPWIGTDLAVWKSDDAAQRWRARFSGHQLAVVLHCVRPDVARSIDTPSTAAARAAERLRHQISASRMALLSSHQRDERIGSAHYGEPLHLARLKVVDELLLDPTLTADVEPRLREAVDAIDALVAERNLALSRKHGPRVREHIDRLPAIVLLTPTYPSGKPAREIWDRVLATTFVECPDGSARSHNDSVRAKLAKAAQDAIPPFYASSRPKPTFIRHPLLGESDKRSEPASERVVMPIAYKRLAPPDPIQELARAPQPEHLGQASVNDRRDREDGK